MRRDLVRAAKWLALPAVALVCVLVFVPGRAELAIRIFALVLAGAALVLLLSALRRAYPRAKPLRPSVRRSGQRREVPGTLARIEDEVALGLAGSFELHHRLRPRVRGIAADVLGSRRGISLDGDPSRAREALGDEAWGLVRADRPPPEDRLARGIPIQDLDRVVESVERL